uniref:Fibrinogen-like protein 1 n=1 Tax=Latimeria chalumnae TaxID=7897 RepID=H3AD02_LATCH
QKTVREVVHLQTALFQGTPCWALAPESCSEELARLRSQVKALELRVKLQHLQIQWLHNEKEMSATRGRGDEDSFIDLRNRKQYADCAKIYNDGHRNNGFYNIQPFQFTSEFRVYCDMSDGGGWTVIQRRSDGSENFDRLWSEYKKGFGNFHSDNGEYWLGNEKLHYLTSQGDYTLRINLLDSEEEFRFAQYKNFKVGDEQSSYQLSFGAYSGTAGDSLSGGFHPEVQWWANHNGMKFSTQDKDNDRYEKNCAKEDNSGWWFNRCHSANLNGKYYNGSYTAKTDDGIVWYTWHGWWYSIKSVVMKIRPAEFEPNNI